MAKRLIDTYTISIKGQPGTYTVEADGPGDICVEPQAFAWSPSPEQSATLDTLGEEGRVAPGALQDLGQVLHRALFVPAIAEAWGRAQVRAERVRLRLAVEPPELAALPWEALHDGAGFLSARSERPLVRALPGAQAAGGGKRLAVRGALRVLFVGASPEGLPALDLQRAAAEVQQRLAAAVAKKRVVVDLLLDATLDELRSKLLEQYHVLYLMGHGSQGAIYLDDGQGGERDEATGRRPAGDADEVTAGELAAELEGKATRLVYVGACDTGVATGFAVELARPGGLPAVVGMQYRIGDGAAGEVAGRFFESLGAMYPVDVALAESRKALMGDAGGGRDAVAPVLYLQAEDGALFRRARNWPVLGLAVVVPLLVASLILAYHLQQQAGVEQQRRIAAETQQAVAEVTSAVRATERAYAQATAEAEALVRATAQAEEWAQRRRVQSRQLAAQVSPEMEASPPRSLLLAVEAIRHTLDEDGVTVTAAEEALRQALASLGGVPLLGHLDSVDAVAFSPDGRWLVTMAMDKGLCLWDVSALYRGRMLDAVETGVRIEPALLLEEARALTFSADERWLAIEGEDGVVRLVDVTDPAQEPVVLSGYGGDAGRMAFSPDGRWLAMADSEGPLRLWDVSALSEAGVVQLTSEPVVLSGYEDDITHLIFSPEGHWLAAASADSVRLWDVAQPMAEPLSPDGTWIGIEAVAFYPDGRSLLLADHDGTAQMWDLADLTVEPLTLHHHEDAVSSMAFSPDGRWLATGEGGFTNLARLWDLSDPESEARILRGHEGGTTPSAVWQPGDVVTLAFSPDSRLLATGSRDGTARLWDVADPATEPLVLHESKGDIWALAFSPDSQWLATGGRNLGGGFDSLARLWDLSDLADPITLSGHEGDIYAMSFTPDGNWLVAAGWDDTLGLWDVPALQGGHAIDLAAQIIALEQYENDITALAVFVK